MSVSAKRTFSLGGNGSGHLFLIEDNGRWTLRLKARAVYASDQEIELTGEQIAGLVAVVAAA